MNPNEIYSILRSAGMTHEGALGLMGNMMAESNLVPNIAQRGMTKLTDAQYTAAVDNGLLDFADSVGYGLCQWTANSRKRKLLQFAKANGTSVGDGDMQTRFACLEMQADYQHVWKTLCASDSIDACSDIVCIEYERPAVNNLEARRAFAHQLEAEAGLVPDACPIDAPCGADRGVSGAFKALAEYIQTKEFQEGYMAFIAAKEGSM